MVENIKTDRAANLRKWQANGRPTSAIKGKIGKIGKMVKC